MAAVEAGGDTVAIVVWGETIEEFLEPIGLDLRGFAERMSGGWLFGYVQALQSQGWRPIIVCASEAVDRRTPLQHAGTGARVWAIPGKRSSDEASSRHPSLHYIGQCWRNPGREFAAVFDEERCAAILVQEYEYFRFDCLGLLAQRIDRPVYATFQGGDVTLSSIERCVRPHSLRRCSGLIVASARERARLTATYPSLWTPVAAIPNPVDTDEWYSENRAIARATLGLPPDALIVINHGRTDVVRKGLDIFVEAWKRFSGDYLNAQAFMIGTGQDREAFARLLRTQSPQRLTWIDSYMTDRARMRMWLSAADVYLMTSRTEGMPVAPLEAMACGLPVISSDAHGLPDVFEGGEEHGGIVVAREDVDGVVKALQRLATDGGLRKRLGNLARKRVESHFSLQAVGTALSMFLREPQKSSP